MRLSSSGTRVFGPSQNPLRAGSRSPCGGPRERSAGSPRRGPSLRLRGDPAELHAPEKHEQQEEDGEHGWFYCDLPLVLMETRFSSNSYGPDRAPHRFRSAQPFKIKQEPGDKFFKYEYISKVPANITLWKHSSSCSN